MSQGFFCDSLLLLLDVVQAVFNVGFGFVTLLFGTPAPNVRDLLGGGSIFGCNL